MPSPFAPLGRVAISSVNDIGAATIFFAKACAQIFQRNQLPRILEQVSHVGAKTMAIVSLIGLFTGMVMALQIYYALAKFGAQGMLGNAVALGLIRELGRHHGDHDYRQGGLLHGCGNRHPAHFRADRRALYHAHRSPGLPG